MLEKDTIYTLPNELMYFCHIALVIFSIKTQLFCFGK